MKADPEVLRGLTSEIEAIIRRHVWARYVAAFDQPQVLGIGAAAAEIAALRAPQNDGAAAMREACARWHDDQASEYDREARERTLPNGEWAGRDAMWARADAQAHREHAAAIRALAQPDPSQEPGTGGEE